MEAAQLSREQIVAGVLTATAVLGLCSCTPTTDPGPGQTAPGVEQTIEPTVDASATPAPEESIPADEVPTEWPATSADYVFSDQPQGAAEQWLFDNYPDQWGLGVRSVTAETLGRTLDGDVVVPQAIVQYVDGQRFVGTVAAPLSFEGTEAVPGQISMAGAEAIEGTYSRESGSHERYGINNYSIRLNPSGKSKDRLSIQIARLDGNNAPYFYNGDTSPHTYANLDEALADIKDGVPLGDGRVLDLAEIAAIVVKSPDSSLRLVDPRTWEAVDWTP